MSDEKTGLAYIFIGLKRAENLVKVATSCRNRNIRFCAHFQASTVTRSWRVRRTAFGAATTAL